LSLGILLALAAGALGAASLYYADRLADFGLPGLAALAAVAANVMFMLAEGERRRRGLG